MCKKLSKQKKKVVGCGGDALPTKKNLYNKNIKKSQIQNKDKKDSSILNNNNKIIKTKKPILKNMSDLENHFMQKSRAILEKNNLSENYKKKSLLIIRSFINYYINKNNNKINLLSDDENTNYIKKRIKISDVEDYITNYKKYKNDYTKSNIQFRLRYFIRKINKESNLNYKTKINPYPTTSKDRIGPSPIIMLASKLREIGDIVNLLILYFLYFGGLNFSYISRIMIKDLKSAFSVLKLKKGRKIITHYIPNIIKGLLLKYFSQSRTYKSKYLFYDNYLEKKGKSRTQYIKELFITSIYENEILGKEEIKKVVCYFSALRRAKFLSQKYYYLFDLSLSKIFEKVKKNIDNNINDIGTKNLDNSPSQEIIMNNLGIASLFENIENNNEEFTIVPRKINFDEYDNDDISLFSRKIMDSISFVSDINN